MSKRDFDLQVMDNFLVVRGEKKLHRERTVSHYHVKECAYGHFERAILLPDKVESDKAKATYRDGILPIELPKSASRRRRGIRVELQ